MTPYEFGQKFAEQRLPVSAKQPMPQAIATVAKQIPGMVNLARSSGTNPIKVINQVEQGIKARTGEFPSNWETTETLMSGLPYPYPAK